MNYEDARPLMLPGDIIAFGGRGWVSNIIKIFTRSQVSHVGTVLQVNVTGDDRYFNNLIESTSLNGFNGVSTSRLSTRVETYKGNIWWLPLSDEVREKFNEKAFFDFLFAQEGLPYDIKQVLGLAFPWLLGHNQEDYQKLFCSELIAGGYESGGLISTNCSEATPIDVVRWNLYKQCHQLKGKPKRIKGFNTEQVLKQAH